MSVSSLRNIVHGGRMMDIQGVVMQEKGFGWNTGCGLGSWMLRFRFGNVRCARGR